MSDIRTDDELLSIVYSSRASAEVAEDDLAAILAASRRNNERLGLTGMLLFRQGRFIQIIEGPAAALRERMAIIVRDDRHTDLATLLEESIEERLFPSWSMGFEAISDEAAALPGYRSSFADLDAGADDGDAGDDPESETARSSRILPALRELIRWYQVRSA